MTSLRQLSVGVALLAMLALAACDSSTDPDDPSTGGGNTLGGDPNVDFVTVGSKFLFGVYTEPYIEGLANLRDSVYVVSNQNGIVTTRMELRVDTTFARAMDTAMGLEALSPTDRSTAIALFAQRYNAVVDSSDPNNVKVTVELKTKVTTEGIQEFMTSRGDMTKPFTVVKYDAAVGDKYTFTDPEGNLITRTVKYRSTTDDYDIGLFKIKIIEVEQTGDPLVERVTFFANHRFGVVGVKTKLTTGKELELFVLPS
jgi:hypothetical protein